MLGPTAIVLILSSRTLVGNSSRITRWPSSSQHPAHGVSPLKPGPVHHPRGTPVDATKATGLSCTAGDRKRGRRSAWALALEARKMCIVGLVSASVAASHGLWSTLRVWLDLRQDRALLKLAVPMEDILRLKRRRLD